jgi:hypothetical protein
MSNLLSSFKLIAAAASSLVVFIAPASATPAFSGTVYNIDTALLSGITATSIKAAFAAGSPACSISTDTIDYTGAVTDFGCSGLSSNFGIDLVSQMIVPTIGSYSFSTTSDDGSMFLIEGVTVVNNAFFQGMTTRSGSAILSAGTFDVELLYFQGGGGDGFIFTPDPNVTFTAVTPEPSTLALGAAGLLLLVAVKGRAGARTDTMN